MFCDQKCMIEAQKRFHDVECEISEENVRKLQYEMPGGVADLLLSLRTIVEAWRMAGSVERLRELTANPNNNGNIFDFDLSHENDEAMDTKHLKILNMLQGLWTEEEIMEHEKKLSKQFLLLKPILQKFFLIVEEDFNFMFKFAVRFMSIQSCNLNSSNIYKTKEIFPFGSFFNHSCKQNVTRVLAFGNKTAYVVLQPVKKGEQLFVHYGLSMSVYSVKSTEKRQQEILQR
jgi:hypothetical protein